MYPKSALASLLSPICRLSKVQLPPGGRDCDPVDNAPNRRPGERMRELLVLSDIEIHETAAVGGAGDRNGAMATWAGQTRWKDDGSIVREKGFTMRWCATWKRDQIDEQTPEPEHTPSRNSRLLISNGFKFRTNPSPTVPQAMDIQCIEMKYCHG
jgi:hypothetical protein